MVEHLQCDLYDARVAASEQCHSRPDGERSDGRYFAVERKTEEQQQQRVARSGFDVNAGVARQERANTTQQLSVERMKGTRGRRSVT